MRTCNRPSHRHTSPRRGGVIIIVALSLLVLLGFAALVVDIGYGRLIRNQVQMSAEAAAFAAAMELNGTEDGMESALSQATAYGDVNKVAGDELAIGSGDLELGVWDGENFTTSSDAEQVNAVRVNPAADDVKTFFAKVAWGEDDLTVGGLATTTRVFGGAGAVDCYLPFAIPSCLIEDKYGLDGIVMQDLSLYPSGGDNMGWARVGASPTDSWARKQILDCEADGEAAVGDTVSLGNGTFTNTLTALGSAISSSDTTWDTSTWGTQPSRATKSSITAAKYGRTYEAPIIVFEDDTYCTGKGKFNENQVIVGFVWAAAYDVVNTTSNKTVKLRLDTLHTYDIGTKIGGEDYGIMYLGPPNFVN